MHASSYFAHALNPSLKMKAWMDGQISLSKEFIELGYCGAKIAFEYI